MSYSVVYESYRRRKSFKMSLWRVQELQLDLEDSLKNVNEVLNDLNIP